MNTNSSKTFLIFYIALISKDFLNHLLSNMEHTFPLEAIFWYGSKFFNWPIGSSVRFLKYLWIVLWFAIISSEKLLWTVGRNFRDTSSLTQWQGATRREGLAVEHVGRKAKHDSSHICTCVSDSMSQPPNCLRTTGAKHVSSDCVKTCFQL